MTITSGAAPANAGNATVTVDAEAVDGVFGPDFKPLTASEAQQWRASHPASSPWRVVVWQVAVGCMVAVLAGAGWGRGSAMSAAYGAFAVVLPAALMVRGMQRQRGVVQPGAAMLGFVVWELVKVAVTVAMLVGAPKLVQPLDWLALVAGFVVTMKVYWVAAWLHPVRRSLNVSN